MAFCTYCGNLLQENASYCDRCGAPATPTTVGAATASSSVFAADKTYVAPKSSFIDDNPARNVPVCVYGPPSSGGRMGGGSGYGSDSGYASGGASYGSGAAIGSYGAPAGTGSYTSGSFGADPYGTGSYGTSGYPSDPTTVQGNPKGSWGWWFLGFIFPLIGLILFLAWMGNRRGDARKSGFGALFGVIARIAVAAVTLLATISFVTSSGIIEDLQHYPDYSFGFDEDLDFNLDDLDDWDDLGDLGGLGLEGLGDLGGVLGGEGLAQAPEGLSFEGLPQSVDEARARLDAMGLTIVESQSQDLGIMSYAVLVASDGDGGYFAAIYMSSELLYSMIGDVLDEIFTQVEHQGLLVKQSGPWMAAGSQSAVDTFLGI